MFIVDLKNSFCTFSQNVSFPNLRWSVYLLCQVSSSRPTLPQLSPDWKSKYKKLTFVKCINFETNVTAAPCHEMTNWKECTNRFIVQSKLSFFIAQKKMIVDPDSCNRRYFELKVPTLRKQKIVAFSKPYCRSKILLMPRGRIAQWIAFLLLAHGPYFWFYVFLRFFYVAELYQQQCTA